MLQVQKARSGGREPTGKGFLDNSDEGHSLAAARRKRGGQ